MQTEQITQAAALLWQTWQTGGRLQALPSALRPADRGQAYAIQAEMARLSGQGVSGWKIAATSMAGQHHIGVDGPLAGRLLQQRVLASGASIPLQHNTMRVAEAEFAFRMAQALPSRSQPYGVEEVMAAVGSLHPAIEVPDSRYHDCARVGAPHLIAENACADWFVLGQSSPELWRTRNLAEHRVVMLRNGGVVREGSGAQVLDSPCLALTWLANELSRYGGGLQPGQIVTTGTCIVPVETTPGDHFVADFGDLGQVTAVMVS